MINTKSLFIVWAPFGRRSELLAQELGAQLYFIHYLKYKTPIYAPAKYVLQAIRTLQVLFAERPALVFVQSPPFVASLAVYLYCWIAGARFVIDHHTASFARRWDLALPVQRFLARRAATNIVTNQHWADVVRSWAADTFILPDPFVSLPRGQEFAVAPGFSVVFINSFAADEPLDQVVQAAAQLPDVHFYITGNTKYAPQLLLRAAPPNVTFTGFLPDDQYFGLLRSARAVMALTTRNYTLQGGGCEAISLGKPLITSDWPYLRELFARGTVYVPNSSAGIRDGVRDMQRRYKELESEVIAFRQERRREWNGLFSRLKKLVRLGQNAPVVSD